MQSFRPTRLICALVCGVVQVQLGDGTSVCASLAL